MTATNTKHFHQRNWGQIPALNQKATSPKKVGVAVLCQSNGTGQPEAMYQLAPNGKHAPDPYVLEVSHGKARNGHVVPATGDMGPATHPLQVSEVGSIGPFQSMGKKLRSLLSGAPSIYMSTTGEANTSFESGRWRVGGDLYEESVARTIAMVNSNPGCKLEVIVIDLGPSDAIAASPAGTIKQDVINAATDYRSRVPGASDAVVVVTSPPDSLTASNPGGDPITPGGGTFPAWLDTLLDLNENGWAGLENARASLMFGLATHDSIHYFGDVYHDSVGPRIAETAVEALAIRDTSMGQSVALTYDEGSDSVTSVDVPNVKVTGGALVTDETYGKVIQTDGLTRCDISVSRPSRSFTVRAKIKILSSVAGDTSAGVGAQLPASTQVPLFAGRSAAQESDGDLGWAVTTRLTLSAADVVTTDLTQNAEVVVGTWFDCQISYDYGSGLLNIWANESHIIVDEPLDASNQDFLQLMQLGGWGTSTAGYWKLQYHGIEILPYAADFENYKTWRAALNYEIPIDAELYLANIDDLRSSRMLTLDGDWRTQVTKSGHYALFYTTAATPNVTFIGLPWSSAATAGASVGAYLLDVHLVTTTQGSITARAYADPSGAPADDWVTREFHGFITRANSSTPWTVYWTDKLVVPGTGTKLYYMEVNEATTEPAFTEL